MAPSATIEREVSELRDQIRSLNASADRKQADAEKLRDDEKAKGFSLTDTSSEAKETFERIDAAYKEADTDRENAAELQRRLHVLLDHAGGDIIAGADGDPRHPAAKRARSIGALVTSSEQYKRLIASGVLGMESARVEMSPVQVLTRDQAKQAFAGGRVFTADVGDGDALVPEDQQLMPPTNILVRMPTLFDLVTIGSTDSDLVAWTRQTTRTNAAAPTAYGTAAPKSRYVWERVESTVKRIPHHVVADKGNLADQAQMQTVIEAEGIEDLRLEVEDQMMSGSGGSGFTGIYNTGSLGSFDAAAADNLPDALHKAITTVRVALEREPTAWGISPEDFEDFYLAKGGDGHYLHHRGPLEGQVPSIWGKPASVSTLFNTAPVVADWARGATLWQRSGITVAASDNVDDFFLEGLVAILFETRSAFAVRRPNAFCMVENFDS